MWLAVLAQELWRLAHEDEVKNTVLLVFSNKHDLPNAMSVEEVREKLELAAFKERPWHIQVTPRYTSAIDEAVGRAVRVR